MFATDGKKAFCQVCRNLEGKPSRRASSALEGQSQGPVPPCCPRCAGEVLCVGKLPTDAGRQLKAGGIPLGLMASNVGR